MRSALAEQQFELYFQPIIDLQSNQIYKAEALIRWQHPLDGMIGPESFIPQAEDSGVIVEVGDWVFREAVQRVQQLRCDHHPEFQISINKSPIQFLADYSYTQSWFQCLHQAELPGDSIVIEITEGLLLDASEQVHNTLFAYRDRGIPVALDDFGVGYSSLSYLNRFDIDYLKIDKMFVNNLGQAANELALCEAIIVMAHKLGLRVIAEGVETIEQHNLLVAAGCDFGQGFLYARPQPFDQFNASLHRGLSL